MTLPAVLLASALLTNAALEPAAAAPVEQRRTTELDGLALSAGIGSQYVLLGLQAAYYFQIPHSLYRLVPYVAAGTGLCGSADSWYCAVSAGVLASWGHKHRVFLNLAYGAIGVYELSLHGEEPVSRAVTGPQLSVGYEYMSFGGFLLRTDLGVGYALSPGLWSARERIGMTLTLIGLGYKF